MCNTSKLLLEFQEEISLKRNHSLFFLSFTGSHSLLIRTPDM